MKHVHAGIAVLLLLTVFICAFSTSEKEELAFYVPEKWPEPVYSFRKNPLTKEGFELGRQLFYDPVLSRDSSISCTSCHLQFSGFTHTDHPLSHGIEGRIGSRNSPVLINLAWNKTFHWDGGVNHLDVQAINPITHPKEMDNTLPEVIRRLSRSANYKRAFTTVFGDSAITTSRIMKALSQFTVSLISADSKYDKVMRGNTEVHFTEQEISGLKLFRMYCVSCHKEPLFSGDGFASNGLPVNPALNDPGRYAVTHHARDSMKFRIPTLRNSEFSFPYMHDGRFRKLKEVIRFYSDSIPTGDRYLDERLRKPLHLTEQQQKDLLAFLYTLTDKAFLFDTRFRYPGLNMGR